jgi:hypothetical protein
MFICFLIQSLSDELPAPRLSSSISFNEKAKWLRSHGNHCDVLVLGSSLALYNIDTLYIKQNFSDKSIINAASFGMSISETNRLLEVLGPICKPKIIILGIAYSDFGEKSKFINFKNLENYLKGKDPLFFSYIKEFDPQYYMSSYRDSKENLNNINYAFNLLFNESGGVLIRNTNKVIMGKFMSKESLNPKNIEIELNALNQIINYSKINNSKLLIVSTPIRKDIEPLISTTAAPIFASVLSLLKKTDTPFYTYENLTLASSDYVDYAHLNSNGSRLITAPLIPIIHQLLLPH